MRLYCLDGEPEPGTGTDERHGGNGRTGGEFEGMMHACEGGDMGHGCRISLLVALHSQKAHTAEQTHLFRENT